MKMYSISKLLFPSRTLNNFSRNIKSALYITGEKAQRMFVAVHPNIDTDIIFKEDELLHNVKKRGINIDLEKLQKRFYFFKTVEEKKIILEHTRDELNALYSDVKNPEENLDKINQLKLHKHVVNEELKSLKEFLTDLQENVMITILNLPNNLHQSTPEIDEVYHQYLERPKHQSQHHMDIGVELNLLKLVDSWGCFLMSDASLFEIAVSNYFIEKLVESKFIPFQNADFTRSVVVEGCGTKVVGNEEVLTLHESSKKNEVLEELSRLHLTGSASIYAFMAYFTKHLVPSGQFPLRYFCYGRSYNGDVRTNDNLFNLNQESVLNVFIATFDDAWQNFQTLTQQIIKLYDALGWHYRLVYLQPDKLNKSESLRLSIQMYSTHSQKYIEVGYVSYFGSYICERLLFCCLNKKEQVYPKIISGNILNIHKLLGCVLENNQPSDKKLLSELLCKYLP
ncbi:serine--tRNA synthetase-like protein Slimp [Coccinella septempunctata]|uniref:serine--tRNA synthetase-like protein Slimp n=1 Tax=Coccinella septempunctata TaxID=41139 RepID=UPI001D08C7B3|nr:serine--tRNA synthetase-like protein Slimp [Coccinella septempunctata]